MSVSKEDVRNLLASIVLIALIVFLSILTYVNRPEDVSIQGQVIKGYVLDFNGVPVDLDDGLDIGVITTQTGPYGFIGVEAIKGFEIARKRVEKDLGIDIRLDYRDSQCDSDMAVLQAASLSESSDFMIVADCYKNQDYVSGIDKVSIVLEPYYGYGTDNQYFFNTAPGAEVAQLFDSINPDLESLAVVFSDDYFGHEYKDKVKEEFRKRFSREISAYAYDVGQEGFVRIASVIAKDKNSAVYFVGLSEGDILHFLNSLRTKGYYNQVFTNIAINPSSLENADPMDVEGLIMISAFNPISSRSVVKEFRDEMISSYGTEPSLQSALSYDALVSIANLQGKDALGELVRTIANEEGVTGLFTMEEDHLQKTFYILTVRNGKLNNLD